MTINSMIDFCQQAADGRYISIDKLSNVQIKDGRRRLGGRIADSIRKTAPEQWQTLSANVANIHEAKAMQGARSGGGGGSTKARLPAVEAVVKAVVVAGGGGGSGAKDPMQSGIANQRPKLREQDGAGNAIPSRVGFMKPPTGAQNRQRLIGGAKEGFSL